MYYSFHFLLSKLYPIYKVQKLRYSSERSLSSLFEFCRSMLTTFAVGYYSNPSFCYFFFHCQLWALCVLNFMVSCAKNHTIFFEDILLSSPNSTYRHESVIILTRDVKLSINFVACSVLPPLFWCLCNRHIIFQKNKFGWLLLICLNWSNSFFNKPLNWGSPGLKTEILPSNTLSTNS